MKSVSHKQCEIVSGGVCIYERYDNGHIAAFALTSQEEVFKYEGFIFIDGKGYFGQEPIDPFRNYDGYRVIHDTCFSFIPYEGDL